MIVVRCKSRFSGVSSICKENGIPYEGGGNVFFKKFRKLTGSKPLLNF